MRKIIGILIAIGLVFTTPVFGKTVLVGLNDIDYQSSPDWREGMIEEQSFETELSEFRYPVWFVSYMPNDDANDVILKIIQQDEVLEKLEGYIPDEVGARKFTSLDAVSFVDYNQDGNTDIFIVKTWEDITVSTVYDGNGNIADRYFVLNRELSDAMRQRYRPCL